MVGASAVVGAPVGPRAARRSERVRAASGSIVRSGLGCQRAPAARSASAAGPMAAPACGITSSGLPSASQHACSSAALRVAPPATRQRAGSTPCGAQPVGVVERAQRDRVDERPAQLVARRRVGEAEHGPARERVVDRRPLAREVRQHQQPARARRERVQIAGCLAEQLAEPVERRPAAHRGASDEHAGSRLVLHLEARHRDGLGPDGVGDQRRAEQEAARAGRRAGAGHVGVRIERARDHRRARR